MTLEFILILPLDEVFKRSILEMPVFELYEKFASHQDFSFSVEYSVSRMYSENSIIYQSPSLGITNVPTGLMGQ